MRKVYQVAGHRFSVNMPDDANYWKCIENCRPFETGDDDAAEEAFSLEVEAVHPLPELEYDEMIYEDKADRDLPLLKLFRTGGNIVVDSSPSPDSPVAGRTVCSPDFKTAKAYINSSSHRSFSFAVKNSLMLLFALSTPDKKTLEFHSSVTVCNGKGYAFLGVSGTGKSTHSSLWIKHIPGCHLLNDDNPIIKVEDDGSVRVYGSPWSGKTPCYKNESWPLGAFVQLEQAPFNEIARCNPFEGYSRLYQACSGLKFNENVMDSIHDTLDALICNVPVFHLKCLPDEAAALLCHDTVTR